MGGSGESNSMKLLIKRYFVFCLVGLTEEPCTSHLPPSEDIAGAEVSPSSSTSSVSDENDSSRQPEAQAEASTSENKDKAKTKRNRCFMCRKKVGLTGEWWIVRSVCVCKTNSDTQLTIYPRNLFIKSILKSLVILAI